MALMHNTVGLNWVIPTKATITCTIETENEHGDYKPYGHYDLWTRRDMYLYLQAIQELEESHIPYKERRFNHDTLKDC